jgi:hypothetical protein
VSAESLPEVPDPDGAAVPAEPAVEVGGLRDGRLVVHQAKVAATDPPVSEISALKAVEPSAGDVAVGEE